MFNFRSSNPGSGSGIRIRDPESGSAIRRNAGSGSGIRIRIKSMRIRNPASRSPNQQHTFKFGKVLNSICCKHKKLLARTWQHLVRKKESSKKKPANYKVKTMTFSSCSTCFFMIWPVLDRQSIIQPH